MTDGKIFDERRCELGEGAFWHPVQLRLYWFDILNRRLMGYDGEGPKSWDFPHMVSAMAHCGYYVAIIASDAGIFLIDFADGETEMLIPIEATNPETRSNDGRPDRMGGFWMSTMGKDPATRAGKGAIYRVYKGAVRKLYDGLTIPNAIAFSPSGDLAYFADTAQQTVWKVALDAEGWPMGEREVFLDFQGTDIWPDGATIDEAGNFWNAQWGKGRVACYAPSGEFLKEILVDAPNTSCVAFGGTGLETLYVTTAMEDMSPEDRERHPNAGKVFAFEGVGKGIHETKFIA